MNYNHPIKNSSTVGIRMMCAIVFLVFSFTWLYSFQADVMAAAQHVYSGGRTSYERFWGAVTITLCLQVLQLVVYSVLRLHKRSYALTYLPSILVLALISDLTQNVDTVHSMSNWWWVFPLVIVIWLGIAMLARALQDIEPDHESYGLFSRAMWINMLQMLLMMIVVAIVGNTNAVFHYRMNAEAKLLKGDIEGALRAGEKSQESDANLQMVRMYALSRSGLLGERLFHYPIVAKSTAMLPTNGESHTTLYPVDSLYRYFGARPSTKMQPIKYLKALERKESTVSRKLADYELCGLLIDKRIDDFVSLLRKYYSENDSLDMDQLPRHYREALTLYTHLRSNPVLVYHHAVMDEDWGNLQELEAQYPDETERKGKVEEQYQGTYWYYYEYE